MDSRTLEAGSKACAELYRIAATLMDEETGQDIIEKTNALYDIFYQANRDRKPELNQ